jgi:cell division protein FtsN
MKDYKEPISRVQKRQQLKRLFVVMGGMVFAFAIFVGGVTVGIQVERERERITQQASPQPTRSEDKKATEGSEKQKSAPSPKKQEEEKMEFTFYDTLTKKGSTEQTTKKTETTTAPREKEQTTEKKEAVKSSPPPTTKDEATKKAPVEKDLYFVQIASFTEKETAEALKDRLTQKGYKVQVIAVQLEEIGLRYRVRLGAYKSLQEALDAQTKVSVEEHITETMVVSEP